MHIRHLCIRYKHIGRFNKYIYYTPSKQHYVHRYEIFSDNITDIKDAISSNLVNVALIQYVTEGNNAAKVPTQEGKQVQTRLRSGLFPVCMNV